MKEFKIGENIINLCTSWDELNLGQLIEFESCIRNKDKFEIEELFMCRIFEILCDVEQDGLDEMSVDQLNEMNLDIQPLLIPRERREPKESIIINGIQYILDQNQSGQRNMKEMKIISLIRNRFKEDIDILPRMLAVIVRPGTIEFSPETGQKIYKLDKLNMDDIEPRAELFKKQAKALDVVEYLSFFLNGSDK